MSQRWQQRPEGSNWGDFGDNDQIGRMNLLTPQRRLNGLREAREGIAFALSLPLDYPGGSALSPFRKPPKLLVETRDDAPFYSYRMACVCSDFFDVCSDDAVQLHTQYSTQWDALSHWGAEFDLDGNGTEVRCYYNGYRADEDLVAPGPDGNASYARKLGIENLAVACPQGRGVLVDLHRVHGRHRVAVGYDDLMRAMEAQGAGIETGDFLCLYTGWADAVLEMNKRPDGEALKHTLCAVLDGSDDNLLKWVDDSGLVAICADNFAVEGMYKPGVNGLLVTGQPRSALPLHNLCLFKLGIHLGELWYFKELADWLRAHHRSSFLLTAPPLRLPGSVGSPVTPVATV